MKTIASADFGSSELAARTQRVMGHFRRAMIQHNLPMAPGSSEYAAFLQAAGLTIEIIDPSL